MHRGQPTPEGCVLVESHSRYESGLKDGCGDIHLAIGKRLEGKLGVGSNWNNSETKGAGTGLKQRPHADGS